MLGHLAGGMQTQSKMLRFRIEAAISALLFSVRGQVFLCQV